MDELRARTCPPDRSRKLTAGRMCSSRRPADAQGVRSRLRNPAWQFALTSSAAIVAIAPHHHWVAHPEADAHRGASPPAAAAPRGRACCPWPRARKPMSSASPAARGIGRAAICHWQCVVGVCRRCFARIFLRSRPAAGPGQIGMAGATGMTIASSRFHTTAHTTAHTTGGNKNTVAPKRATPRHAHAFSAQRCPRSRTAVRC